MFVKGAVELFPLFYLIASSSHFTSVLENHVQTELEF